jgi:sigma-B regulation protein RsbU (phosphoserine phosphatase)
VAIAIENARLYEEIARREQEIQADLEAASRLQAIIMPPEAPSLPGLEIGLRLKPARLVSGDVYDFFDYDAEHAMIAFGDSSGKGAAAALYGSLVSGLLRAAAPRKRSPAQLLLHLNETLMERQIPARYITLLVMLWKAGDRSFLIANAGQTTPLVCRDGAILQPQASGVPVGLLQQVEYDESEFRAEPGDLVVLVSDGVHDQANPAGEEYGRRRLQRYIANNCHLRARAVAHGLLEDLDAFRESAAVLDDQTVLVLKVA